MGQFKTIKFVWAKFYDNTFTMNMNSRECDKCTEWYKRIWAFMICLGFNHKVCHGAAGNIPKKDY